MKFDRAQLNPGGRKEGRKERKERRRHVDRFPALVL